MFVGRIELVTPETTRRIEEAMAESDLDPILKRIVAGDASRELQIASFRMRIAA